MLRLLDPILSLTRLNAVQWVYGAGKALQLIAEDLDDAKRVCAALSPAGVWITVHGEHECDDALRFLDWIAKWSRGECG